MGTRMSPADAVWLLGETRRNPMTISALLWLDGPVDLAVLRGRVEERIVARHPAFRQRIVPPRLPGALPRWEDAPGFDLDEHLTVVDLPPPGEHALLEARCSLERSTPLDPTRPRWHSTIYRDYRAGGTAIHTRLHHGLGDGVSLLNLVLGLCDDRSPAPEHAEGSGSGPARGPDPRRMLGSAWSLVEERIADPSQLRTVGRGLASAAGWTSRLLLPDMAPPNLFHGTPQGTKRMAWDPEGRDLGPVEAVGKVRDATVNDVLLTILTTALRRYLLARDGLVDALLIMVPISLRDPREPLPARFGNRIGLLPLHLPVGSADPHAQLRRLRSQSAELKDSPAPVISQLLLAGSALATAPGTRLLHRSNQLRSSGVVTNVPGPAGPWYLTGSRVLGTIGWGGLTAELNLTGSFFTLDNRLFAGFVTDTAVIADPDQLLSELGGAWDQVLEQLAA